MCKGDSAAIVNINLSHSRGARFLDSETSSHPWSFKPHAVPWRFCLTSFVVRRNYDYIEKSCSDGQAWTTRSEDAGAQAHRDAQSTSRYRCRSSVQRESVLRPEGSSASPLRDAPTPCRREHVDSRRRGRFWGLTAHFLSGPSGLQPVWPSGLITESAGAERRPQGHRRSSGLCGKSACGGSQPDDPSVRASRPAALWNYGPSAQPRAGFGAEQKKTTPPDVKSSLAHDVASAYETLRPHLIDSADQSGATTGRSVLLRHGMLAWARAYNQASATLPSVCQPVWSPVPSALAMELVQIMAGLILSNGKDACHA